MQNSTLVWIILGALLVLGGGWYFVSSQAAPASVGENVEEHVDDHEHAEGGVGVDLEADVGAGTGGSSEEGAAPTSARVTYSASGFSPSTVTVKVGGTVTWADTGTGKMWVASASHPTHTQYSGTTLAEHCGTATESTAFDQCEDSSTFSFTFTKAGTWRYHNHSQSSHFGTVIVEE